MPYRRTHSVGLIAAPGRGPHWVSELAGGKCQSGLTGWLDAHAAGLTDVVLPERNRADLDDVPEHVRDEMTFHPVMTIGEVLELALEPAREALAA